MSKYLCITKVAPNKFIRHHVDDLLSYTRFLDKNWADWRWFNVFDASTRVQLASFTNKNKPTSKRL